MCRRQPTGHYSTSRTTTTIYRNDSKTTYGETSTIQRQLSRQKSHYSKAVLTGDISTIQRQFLGVKFPLFKGSSYGDKDSPNGEACTIH